MSSILLISSNCIVRLRASFVACSAGYASVFVLASTSISVLSCSNVATYMTSIRPSNVSRLLRLSLCLGRSHFVGVFSGTKQRQRGSRTDVVKLRCVRGPLCSKIAQSPCSLVRRNLGGKCSALYRSNLPRFEITCRCQFPFSSFCLL